MMMMISFVITMLPFADSLVSAPQTPLFFTIPTSPSSSQQRTVRKKQQPCRRVMTLQSSRDDVLMGRRRFAVNAAMGIAFSNLIADQSSDCGHFAANALDMDAFINAEVSLLDIVVEIY